jgi:hypothetical protein
MEKAGAIGEKYKILLARYNAHISSGTAATFDWNNLIRQQEINEYARYISNPGQWLIVSDLNIIARVFEKTISYYPNSNTNEMILNPGKKYVVEVQFNGSNHYERLENRNPTSKVAVNKPVVAPILSPPAEIIDWYKIFNEKNIILPQSISQLRALDLSNVFLNPDKMEKLMKGLASVKEPLKLNDLNLSNTQLTRHSIDPLLAWLTKYRDIQILNLNNNFLGGYNGRSYFPFIRSNAIEKLVDVLLGYPLRKLGLENVELDNENASSLRGLLEDSIRLTTLSWGKNPQLTQVSIDTLAGALSLVKARACSLNVPGESIDPPELKDVFAWLRHYRLVENKSDDLNAANYDDWSPSMVWSSLYEATKQIVAIFIPVKEAKYSKDSSFRQYQQKALEIQKTLSTLPATVPEQIQALAVKELIEKLTRAWQRFISKDMPKDGEVSWVTTLFENWNTVCENTRVKMQGGSNDPNSLTASPSKSTRGQVEWFQTAFLWHVTAYRDAAGSFSSTIFTIDNPITALEKVSQEVKETALSVFRACTGLGEILHGLGNAGPVVHALNGLMLGPVAHVYEGIEQIVEAGEVVADTADLHKLHHMLHELGSIPSALFKLIDKTYLSSEQRLVNFFRSFKSLGDFDAKIAEVMKRLTHMLESYVLSKVDDNGSARQFGLGCGVHFAEGLMLGMFRNQDPNKDYVTLQQDDFARGAMKWLTYVPMKKNYTVRLADKSIATADELLRSSGLAVNIKNSDDRIYLFCEKSEFRVGADYKPYSGYEKQAYEPKPNRFGHRFASADEVALLKRQTESRVVRNFEIHIGPGTQVDKIVGEASLSMSAMSLEVLEVLQAGEVEIEAIPLPLEPQERGLQSLEKSCASQRKDDDDERHALVQTLVKEVLTLKEDVRALTDIMRAQAIKINVIESKQRMQLGTIENTLVQNGIVLRDVSRPVNLTEQPPSRVSSYRASLFHRLPFMSEENYSFHNNTVNNNRR